MPNWCYNHLEVTGPEADILHFKNATVNSDGHFSFHCLVPMPEALRAPNSGDAWYQWSVDNWGTKWDVDGREVGFCEDKPGDGTGKLTYDFSTAWSPATEWASRASISYPTLRFAIWFDEPGCDFSGLEIYRAGLLDITSSWSGPTVSSGMCAVGECEEWVEGRPVTDFHRAPKPEELEVFCEEHALVEAVVDAIRESGEQVTVVPRAQA